ncbi:MAG: hypothetical protein NVS2B12_34340 [Ktedonobacteraceae bacterium]
MSQDQQVDAVFRFMMFLNDTLTRTTREFGHETSCSPEEANIIRVLMQEGGSLMVKEIAQAMHNMNLSKLTRLLDSLEKHGYITRTLNREDRRSFIITPTEQGLRLLDNFMHELSNLASGMLLALTPAERLMIVELFNKMQTNWNGSMDST